MTGLRSAEKCAPHRRPLGHPPLQDMSYKFTSSLLLLLQSLLLEPVHISSSSSPHPTFFSGISISRSAMGMPRN